MAESLRGSVALITGAARGQGRSHALRLAREGARVIAVDACSDIESLAYKLATQEDLQETVDAIAAIGGEAAPYLADVRNFEQVTSVVDDVLKRFGTIDVVVANAGIAPLSQDMSMDQWKDVIDVNLSGVFHTVYACGAALKQQSRGSVILTGSVSAESGFVGQTPGGFGYTASKHAVLGLMRAFALEWGPYGVRVNAVLPGGVATPMVMHSEMEGYLSRIPEARRRPPVMPVPIIDAEDISAAVAWLASDESRYVNGVALPVDGGALVR
ncbi:mycofactocin-coupled SDR family oxidoreductase [Rhodococcus sp. (in: high G+C Gram-positive bacteria)]|uniref:mycofactocin-coupled SDR family oxidoreductase n=1 Tax=Rhodococcus sp. TaxID=1831 RepID=UPI0025810DA1|nr:mycofactocin-coupled SDR family oxidoreductase [Rhodococcus sp. (in: high G+C Gram-positive bacteria)]MBQ7804046.1 mycofactocin-coupled SDR family oxidoreductase [Rhodococcus sp. (in: high G+C Gram-positive bacteria)]